MRYEYIEYNIVYRDTLIFFEKLNPFFINFIYLIILKIENKIQNKNKTIQLIILTTT